MAVNFTSSLLPQEQAPQVLAWNNHYINNDRQTFLAIVSAVFVATALILTGTFLICANSIVGFGFVAAIILGTLTIVIGSSVLLYVLIVTLKKTRAWTKNFLSIKRYIQPILSKPISHQKRSAHISSFFCSSPLDIESYGSPCNHPLAKTHIILSAAGVLSGVSLLVSSVALLVLCSSLCWLGWGLGVIGATVLTASLFGIRSHSLIAQGASYIYINHYQKHLREKLEKLLMNKEKQLLALENRESAQKIKISVLQEQIKQLTKQIEEQQENKVMEKSSSPKPPSPSSSLQRLSSLARGIVSYPFTIAGNALSLSAFENEICDIFEN